MSSAHFKWYAVVVCFGAGVVMITAAIRNLLRGADSHTWPQVTGRVLRSGIDPDTEYGHHLEVEYEYQVNGRTYRSDRLSYGRDAYGTREDAELELARYRAGMGVAVFYNPERPDMAVLRQSRAWSNVFMLAGGVAFVCFGVVALREL